ncbi:MAG: pyridoxal phosphate-dependent aminotransferase [Candidatus Odinarchaeota archaeon]|nr:pyridoxal phosphate-dependent aminotransferase [Candidatus Odinarchaeota archaeon]
MLKFSKVSTYAVKNPSAIREIMNVVSEYNRNPELYPRPLIYLGGGWPQDAPPNMIRNSLFELASDDELWLRSTRYGATAGEYSFRETVCKYEREIFGRRVSPDNVIIGLGSTELTAALFIAIIDKGSEVILTRPSYLNYRRQLEVEVPGSKVRYWPIIKDGRFSPSLEELRDLIDESTRAVLLTIPGNPDGQIFGDDLFEEVRKVCNDMGIWLIVDCAYRTFVYDEYPKYFSSELNENEVWVMSFSKELRVPGWRVAYILASEELVDAIQAIEQARTLCPSRMIQEILEIALSDEEKLKELKRFYDESRVKYSKVADHAYRRIREEVENCSALKPKGGFYVFFDVSEYSKDSKKICKELLEKYQVALAPGVDFGMEGWLRLSFAPVVNEMDKLEEGLNRIKEYFKVYDNRNR